MGSFENHYDDRYLRHRELYSSPFKNESFLLKSKNSNNSSSCQSSIRSNGEIGSFHGVSTLNRQSNETNGNNSSKEDSEYESNKKIRSMIDKFKVNYTPPGMKRPISKLKTEETKVQTQSPIRPRSIIIDNEKTPRNQTIATEMKYSSHDIFEYELLEFLGAVQNNQEELISNCDNDCTNSNLSPELLQIYAAIIHGTQDESISPNLSSIQRNLIAEMYRLLVRSQEYIRKLKQNADDTKPQKHMAKDDDSWANQIYRLQQHIQELIEEKRQLSELNEFLRTENKQLLDEVATFEEARRIMNEKSSLLDVKIVSQHKQIQELEAKTRYGNEYESALARISELEDLVATLRESNVQLQSKITK